MPELIPAQATGAAIAPTRHARSDQHLIELWLHGRSPHTQRAYRADAHRFLVFVGRPLPTVTLGDLQAFADSLAGKPSSRARTLAAISRCSPSASGRATCPSTSAPR